MLEKKLETFVNPKVKYRNGKTGTLLTSKRLFSAFCVLTMEDEHQELVYHTLDGKYLGLTEENDYDIILVL